MRSFNRAQIAEKLSAHPVQPMSIAEDVRVAAVSVVIRPRAGANELLYIERAHHESDPWAGHMAFPGGKVDPEDDSALAAAIRETEEEISLPLSPQKHLLGPLSWVQARAKGQRIPLVIKPYVFWIDETPTLVPDPSEVASVDRIPLPALADSAHRSTCTRKISDVPFQLPVVNVASRKIWGLTLHMTDELLLRLGLR